MSLAHDLADRLEREADQLVALLESLDDAQWRRTAVNTPNVRMNDEDEGRPVAVIAHHVAATMPLIIDIARGLAEGPPAPPLSPADINRMNARHAGDHPDPGRGETIALLREEAGRAAAAIRGWSDDQLEREIDRPGSRTARQVLERILIGHAAMHRLSIEATIQA